MDISHRRDVELILFKGREHHAERNCVRCLIDIEIYLSQKVALFDLFEMIFCTNNQLHWIK